MNDTLEIRALDWLECFTNMQAEMAAEILRLETYLEPHLLRLKDLKHRKHFLDDAVEHMSRTVAACKAAPGGEIPF